MTFDHSETIRRIKLSPKEKDEFQSWGYEELSYGSMGMMINRRPKINMDRITEEMYGTRFIFLTNVQDSDRKLYNRLLRHLNGKGRHKYVIKPVAYDCYGQIVSKSFAVLAMKPFSRKHFWKKYHHFMDPIKKGA